MEKLALTYKAALDPARCPVLETMRKNFLAVVLTLGAAALSLGVSGCSKYYRVAELDAGGGRSVSILAERDYDNTQPVYYEVRAEGRVVVPRTYISSIEPDDTKRLRLKLVWNKAGSVCGVVDERLPQKLWVLHNFKTGETWPRCESGGLERCEQGGEALLHELQKDYPEVGYTL
jgi:hypothetical protein